MSDKADCQEMDVGNCGTTGMSFNKLVIRLCVVPIRSVIILVVNKSDEHSLFPYHYFEVR